MIRSRSAIEGASHARADAAFGWDRRPLDIGNRIPNRAGTDRALESVRRFSQMYSILYIIGAIVVIVVVLRLLGLM
jgi:hypothetical protein